MKRLTQVRQSSSPSTASAVPPTPIGFRLGIRFYLHVITEINRGHVKRTTFQVHKSRKRYSAATLHWRPHRIHCPKHYVRQGIISDSPKLLLRIGMNGVSAYLEQALWTSWMRRRIVSTVTLDELRAVCPRRGSSYRQSSDEGRHYN